MIPPTGVIIPSAGRGIRMGSGLPKQLQTIGGKTVLAHTLTRIMALEPVCHLVIPCFPEGMATTRQIAVDCLEKAQKTDTILLEVIPGGSERMHSVERGLERLMKTGSELVLVHDVVRPCFSLEATVEVLAKADSGGAAILAIPSRDTVKMVDEHHRVTATPDRKNVWLAQTPQVFRKEVLCDAYEKAKTIGVTATDDASLVESAGYPVYVVESSQENIKITYPADLYFVEQWLKTHKWI